MRIMRSYITVLFFLLLSVMSISVCSANLSEDEIAIGGIPYHATADYVKSIYGEPTNMTTTTKHALWTGKIDNYYYGDSFTVIFRNGEVICLGTTADNGLSTPAGIKVGMKASYLVDVYASGKETKNKKGIVTSYFYRSEKDSYTGLRFDVNERGIITAIYAGQFDSI